MATPSLCSVPDCEKPTKGGAKICSMHEARMRRGGTYERRQPRKTLAELLGGRTQVGHWTILGEGEPYHRRTPDGSPHPDGIQRTALCRCECGSERSIAIHTLKQGQSRHCGCKQAEINERTHLRHGDTRRAGRAPEYGIWSKMIGRCTNPNDSHFAHYGGRGISVCDRWKADYVNFLADMGRRPSSDHSIDRIDVDGNYEPGNVRWATDSEQMQNVRHNVRVEYGGETLALIEACRRAGIANRYKVVHRRMKRGGMTFAEAVAKEGIAA